MNIIKKLFKRNDLLQSISESELEKLLFHLPPCNRDVVIASPRYGESHYNCEIVVAAEHLLPWAESHAKSVRCFCQDEQIAREALPVWLAKADVDNDTHSYISEAMFKVLRPYVLNFINNGHAVIVCPKCQSHLSKFQKEVINDKRHADWSWWTDAWTCSCGHQLYYEEHEMHVYFGRN